MEIALLRLPRPKRISPDVWNRVLKEAEAAVQRLSTTIKKIEEAVGIAYPKVEVIPLAILHPATQRIYFGAFGWMPDKEKRQLIPVVRLTLPALLYADEDTLICHLLHELLHYIDSAVLILTNRVRLFELADDLKRRREVRMPTKPRRPTIEARIDGLARKWIRDKSLLTMFLEYETRPSMKNKLYDMIMEKWIKKEMPVTDIRWFDEIFVDIIKRAAKEGIVESVYIDPVILRKSPAS